MIKFKEIFKCIKNGFVNFLMIGLRANYFQMKIKLKKYFH